MVPKALGEVAVVCAVEDAVKEVTAAIIKSLTAGKVDYTTRDAGDPVIGYIQT
jgi:hypothetical protein